MGNKSVLSEIGSLMWNHPYVSCSLLVFLTPPFFPILRFFSPLLISTALFVVALVTMGPHFEQPSDQDDDFLINASEFKVEEEAESSRRSDDVERDVEAKKPTRDTNRSTWSDWVRSFKDSGIMWVEKKLQNENWKGGSLNDDNVSILQEAFAHRAEEKPRMMTKLVTRRIPDEDERAVEEPGSQRQDVIPALSHSDSWTSSDRSFERPSSSFSSGGNTRDLPAHNFFSPHPSFSRRHESDVNPLFENVIPPPIDYDMPPLITGPASITAPLFKSLADDMDMSEDEDDHHHSDHEHLEVGESTVDVANGTHHQPVESLASPSDEGRTAASPEMLLQQETGASVSSLASSSTHADPVHTPPEESAPPAIDAPEAGQLPSAEEQSTPAVEILPESHCQGESSQSNEELQDVPDLEDVLPVEDESRETEIPAEASAAALPDEVLHDIVPAASEAPTEHTGEVLSAPTDVSEEPPPHVVERSMSLPVHDRLADAPTHEDLPPLVTSVPEEAPHPAASLSHAISLPAALTPMRPVILPPKPTDLGPLSPDTDLGTVTTVDHGKEARHPAELFNSTEAVREDELDCKQLSTTAKLLNIEALGNAIAPSPPAAQCSPSAPPPEVNQALQATTEEQVTQVAEKMPSVVEDSPSKTVFQPDAPQLQITPPSTKVVLTPPAKPSVGPSVGPPVGAGRAASSSTSFMSRYSSSEDDSGDEEIDLDSDVEVVGEDSDSDLDLPSPVKAGTTLKPPPKPPLDQIPPPHTAVQA